MTHICVIGAERVKIKVVFSSLLATDFQFLDRYNTYAVIAIWQLQHDNYIPPASFYTFPSHTSRI